MTDIHDLTVTELAAAIGRKELSPVQITAHYLDRTDRLNADVGAFFTVTAELATSQAAEAEKAVTQARDPAELPPLTGIPIPIKDLNMVAGVRQTLGSAVYADNVPATDDHVTAALRAAGAVLTGKTATPEFGLPCYTETAVGPPARTPWDLSRSAGGSSGGAAAAVAAGLAPAAQGSDGGGSIRIPSSVCGLFGLKPSRGRISGGPLVPDLAGLVSEGPLARSVADAALLLDVLAGRPAGEPPVPDADGLRLGLATELLALADESIAARIRGTAEALAAAGAAVEERSVPDPSRATAIHRLVQAAEAATVHAPWFEEQRDRYAPDVRARLEAGRQLSAEVYLRAQRHRRLFTRDFAAAMEGLDAILAPSSPVTAPPLEATAVTINGSTQPLRPALLSCVLPISQLDCPAVSVPIGMLEGLPVGMQLIGRPGSESLLLGLAAAVEEIAEPVPVPLLG